jgi:acetamidase/formamidase
MFYLDLDRKIAEFAPGIEIPLAPFPGTLAVLMQSPANTALPPGRAGNLDIRDADRRHRAVRSRLSSRRAALDRRFARGARQRRDQPHRARDGLQGNERHRRWDQGMSLEWPRIKTKDAWITIGLDRDLTRPRNPQGETSKFLTEQRKLNQEQAAKLMMAAWDCRISQVVDVNKGIHGFSAKGAAATRKIEACPKENKTYLVTVGKDADLNKAMDDASWAMIELLQNEKKLSRLDAYSLASMVMDCRLAAPAGPRKSVHCLVPKSTWLQRGKEPVGLASRMRGKAGLLGVVMAAAVLAAAPLWRPRAW